MLRAAATIARRHRVADPRRCRGAATRSRPPSATQRSRALPTGQPRNFALRQHRYGKCRPRALRRCHAVPMGNYVIGVGNYMIATPSELGNYKIADTRGRLGRHRLQSDLICVPPLVSRDTHVGPLPVNAARSLFLSVESALLRRQESCELRLCGAPVTRRRAGMSGEIPLPAPGGPASVAESGRLLCHLRRPAQVSGGGPGRLICHRTTRDRRAAAGRP
jgi:hypothetical protein